MDTRIRIDRRSTQFLGILILVMCLAMPAPASAAEGNKHTGSVLRTPEAKGRTVIIAPPKTSDEISLKAEEKPVTVVNKWYCNHSKGLVDEENFSMNSERDAIRYMANGYLKNQDLDAVGFWSATSAANAPYEQTNWVANPAQGKTVTKTWKNCYSMQELEAAKKEALRWANFILKKDSK